MRRRSEDARALVRGLRSARRPSARGSVTSVAPGAASGLVPGPAAVLRPLVASSAVAAAAQPGTRRNGKSARTPAARHELPASRSLVVRGDLRAHSLASGVLTPDGVPTCSSTTSGIPPGVSELARSLAFGVFVIERFSALASVRIIRCMTSLGNNALCMQVLKPKADADRQIARITRSPCC